MPVHYCACAVARFVARNTTPRSARFVCVFAAAFMWQLQVCPTAQLIWLQMNLSTTEYKTFGRFSCDVLHNTIKHYKNRNRPTVLISLLQTQLITLRSVKLIRTNGRQKWGWRGDILFVGRIRTFETGICLHNTEISVSYFLSCAFLFVTFIIFIIWKIMCKPYVQRVGRKQILLLLSKRYLLQTLEIEMLNRMIYCRHARKHAYQASICIDMSTLNWVRDLKYSDGLHPHIVSLKPLPSNFNKIWQFYSKMHFADLILFLLCAQANLTYRLKDYFA